MAAQIYKNIAYYQNYPEVHTDFQRNVHLDWDGSLNTGVNAMIIHERMSDIISWVWISKLFVHKFVLLHVYTSLNMYFGSSKVSFH